jgi:very-short-patch-repair endonuclease
MNYCHCGCGRLTNTHPYTTKKLGWIKNITYYNYITGHNNKKSKEEKIKYKEEKYKKLGLWYDGKVCLCGCGEKVTIGRNYKSGHDSRCNKYTINMRGKTYEEIYGKIKGEEKRKKVSDGHLGQISNKNGKCFEEIYGTYRAIIIKDKIKNARAKQIPKYHTLIEQQIQHYLKKLSIKFYKHKYINKIKDSYQCDIFIPKYNLVIECDGNYWHKYPHGTEIDNHRTYQLLEQGFKVLRLWESEIVNMNLDNFKRRLKLCIAE